MLFEVTHTIEFSYSQPVFLEPHTVRLRPRDDGWQRLLSFDLRVEPSPAGLSDCIELDGNATAHVWFEGLQEGLTISTAFTVETLRTNPFDFILDSGDLHLPMVYPEGMRSALAPYLLRNIQAGEVTDFARGVLQDAESRTLPFLDGITSRVHETCEFILRLEGDPWPPATTLAKRRGACRDLAVLMMDACRAVGLAARFVSGYLGWDPPGTEPELHAWVEVYLPGVGWRPYDPTHGVAVSDRHIALAAGASPAFATPTSGTFRGTGATSTMRTEVSMKITPA